MEINYVYFKTRAKFGKQCFFDDDRPKVDVDIAPNHELMEDYLHKDVCHTGVQMSKQFALHETQTPSKVLKESGMCHLEGGWSKEINSKDEEATMRFRRRIEKDDIWAPKMNKLMNTMEECIKQNNITNIYENYFDDFVPTQMLLPLDIRTVNTYVDPQENVRPVTHISWSPDYGNRLVVSYCFMDFQRDYTNENSYSYIWDIDNPNTAYMALKAFIPSVTIEFNPRDPSLLISGLMTGQVCSWDIRTGNVPTQCSHPLHSHRNPVNTALWVNSKTHSEFFSASTSGSIMWWDIRNLRKPTEILIMDLEDPLRADVGKAIGVSSLEFESSMSTKFMAGMENGTVISGNKKGQNAQQKLALRFNCHNGPVFAVDRNPFYTKYFLTIGTRSAKVWAEDTKEGNLVSTYLNKEPLTGGCWSNSRYSVFYVVTKNGDLKIFDLLTGIESPVKTLKLCENQLQALAPHEEGKLVAVGGCNGIVYLVESSEALITNAKHDKGFMISYLEQCSNFEKAIDNRMKEIRLALKADKPEISNAKYEADHVVQKFKAEDRVKSLKEKKKVDDETKITRLKKKDVNARVQERQKKEDKVVSEKRKKLKGKESKEIIDDPELANAETIFYDIIRKEIEKYAVFENDDAKATKRVKVKIDEQKRDKKAEKKDGKDRKDRTVRQPRVKGGKEGKKERPSEIVILRKKPEKDFSSEQFDERTKLREKGEEEEKEEKLLEMTLDLDRTVANSVVSDKRTSILATSRLEKVRKLSHESTSPEVDSERPCEYELWKPKICSAYNIDSEKQKRSNLQADLIGKKSEQGNTMEYLNYLSQTITEDVPSFERIMELSDQDERKILRLKDAAPDIIRQEVIEARKGLEEYRVKVMAHKAGAPIKIKTRTEMKSNEEESRDETSVSVKEAKIAKQMKIEHDEEKVMNGKTSEDRTSECVVSQRKFSVGSVIGMSKTDGTTRARITTASDQKPQDYETQYEYDFPRISAAVSEFDVQRIQSTLGNQSAEHGNKREQERIVTETLDK